MMPFAADSTGEASRASLVPEGTELSVSLHTSPNTKGVRNSGTHSGAGEKASEAGVKKGKIRLRFRKIKLPGIGELSWGDLWRETVKFLSNPVNLAAFLWCVLATAASVVVVAVKVGLLNEAIPDHHVRDEVDEIATQVLNALFALMCLVWHPAFCRDVWLLIRWHPLDKVELRQEFCKGGKRKPHDRFHMSMVFFWLQVTCWTTYAFSAVYWVYPMGQRPFWLLISTTIASFVAPIIAFLWQLLSPLSQDFDIVKEGDEKIIRMYQRTQAFFVAHKEVRDPKWNGSVFPGCLSDNRVACLTFFLPCCMFGYNMERLGFGHRAIHASMIAIVLFGPILLFELGAVRIEREFSRDLVSWMGIAVALLGLGYGGLWRIRMRETYKLPGSRVCCGSRRLTDVCAWMFCSCCVLCQEVRTTDQYQIGDSSFYQQAVDEEAGKAGLEAAPVAVVRLEDGDEFEDSEGDDEEEGEGMNGVTAAPSAHRMQK